MMWSTFRPALAGTLRATRGAASANRLTTFAGSRAQVLRTTPTRYVFNNQVRCLATPASGQARAEKSAGIKKTAAKKAPASKKAGTKRAAAKKKPVKKKVAKKPAKKVVRKNKKVVLAPEKKQKVLIRDLRKVALLSGQPTQLPNSVWTVYSSQNLKGVGANLTSSIKAVADQYKALPAAEVQALQEIADKNKVVNAANRKIWVESHSPTEIHAAIKARNYLRRLGKFKGHRIQDERLPKRPAVAWCHYMKARWGSGDFDNGLAVEATRKIKNEWNNLSEAERKPYEDLYQNELHQYKRRRAEVGIGKKA